jgi:hypothetical protein
MSCEYLTTAIGSSCNMNTPLGAAGWPCTPVSSIERPPWVADVHSSYYGGSDYDDGGNADALVYIPRRPAGWAGLTNEPFVFPLNVGGGRIEVVAGDCPELSPI